MTLTETALQARSCAGTFGHGSPDQDAVERVLLACCRCQAQDALAAELQRLGHRVFRASSVAEMLEGVRSQQPSLIAMELRLEHVVTLGLLGALRDATHPRARLVITTKYESAATAFRAFQLGVDGYFVHPVTANQLLRADGSRVQEPLTPQSTAVMSLTRAVWEYINRKRVAAGTMTEAAERLGLDRRSLRRMLAKYPPAR